MKSKILVIFFSIIFLFGGKVFSQAVFIKINSSKEFSARKLRNKLEIVLNNKKEDVRIKRITELNLTNSRYGIFVVMVNNYEDAEKLRNAVANEKDFEYSQIAGAYHIENAPNDPYYSSQWGLNKINIGEAWEKTEGSNSVVIGLIDTGVDFLHPDLEGRFFLNYGEIGTDANGNDKRSNGIDDDGNGFTDDYRGWNFLSSERFPNGNNNPTDDQGHGTVVSGIMGALRNNGIGIAGINDVSKILITKAFDSDGYGKEEDVAAALVYLVNNGADVINMSFGDYTYSQVMKDIVAYAVSRGAILVGSAGNSSSASEHYPSGFEEVISVGASDENDNLAGFSNYGTSLDLLAPGVNIISTLRNGEYGVVSGTSASAPFVTATVSLLLALRPDLSYEEVRQILRTTARDIYDSGYDIYSGAGILDAGKAVSASFNSVITINSPTEDAWFSENSSIAVNVTALSPFFASLKLELGEGENPTAWEQVYVSERQIADSLVAEFSSDELSDTNYTLRLSVTNTDGTTREVYRHFGVDKTPPVPLWYDGYPAYVGGKPTFYSNTYTNEFTKAKFYLDDSPVYLDNVSHNIGDNRYLHSGYFPADLVNSGTIYNFDVLYTNKAGSTSRLSDFVQGNLEFQADEISDETVLREYAGFMINGEPYSKPIEIDGKKYLAVNEFDDITTLKFYEIINDTALAPEPEFVLPNRRIPAYAGKIESFGDGKLYLVSFLYPNLYIDVFNEQTRNFENKLTSGELKNLLYAGNLFGDFYLVASSENLIEFYRLNADFTFFKQTVENQSPAMSSSDFANNIVSQNATVIDFGETAKVFFSDYEGDLISVSVFPGGPAAVFMFGEYYATYEISTKSMLAVDSTGALHALNLGDDEYYPEPTWFYSKYDVNNSIQPIVNKAFIANNQINNLNTVLVNLKNGNENLTELLLGSEIYLLNNGANVYYDVANGFDMPLRSVYYDGASRFSLPSDENTQTLFDFSGTTVPKIIKSYALDTNSVYLQFTNSNGNVAIYRKNGENYEQIAVCSDEEFTDTTAQNGWNYYLLTYDNVDFSDTISVFAHKIPQMISAEHVASKSVKVTFDGKMSRTSPLAPESSFYFVALSNRAKSAVFVDDYSYLINFEEPLPPNRDLRLAGRKLTDFYGSPLPFTYVGFTTQTFDDGNYDFYVSAFKIVSPKSVEISFNLPLDSSSAGARENYVIEPKNEVIAVEIIAENAVKIMLQNPVGALGINYLLTVRNVQSAVSAGSVPIAEGSGSQVMLIGVKESLADEYVFPNPVNATKSEKLTFANLTSSYRISIYDITGKLIKIIEKNDSPGACVWNLRDLNGREIPSGVYIYYIENLNAEGEVSETKTNKFAVVR